MSFTKNSLKSLLKKLLDERLKRLEKRNEEQLSDLKLEKYCYKKQNEVLKKLHIIKVKERPPFVLYYNKNYAEKLRSKTPEYLSPTRRKNNNRKKNYLTPVYPKNTIPNYLKHKGSPKNKNSLCSISNMYKRNLTPDPKIRHKKKNKNKQKNDTQTTINIKIQTNTTTNETNTNLYSNNSNNENNDSHNDSFCLEDAEKNIPKKVTIISDIDLNGEVTSDLIEEMRKKQNIQNNIQYTKVEKSEISKKFGKFLLSSDGVYIIKIISSYLDNEAKFNFFSCNKKLIRQLSFYVEDIYENILKVNEISYNSTIDDKINELKNKYNSKQLEPPLFSFGLSRGTEQGIDFLNEDSYNDIFMKKELKPPLNEIIIVYRIFFQLMDKNNFTSIKDDNLFWNKICNYILENNNGKTGDFFKDCVDHFDFSGKNILKIRNIAFGNEYKLKPVYFSNICKTTMFVVHVVKDSLEYCSVIKNGKKNIPGLNMKYLDYLNELTIEIKKYIDILKRF